MQIALGMGNPMSHQGAYFWTAPTAPKRSKTCEEDGSQREEREDRDRPRRWEEAATLIEHSQRCAKLFNVQHYFDYTRTLLIIFERAGFWLVPYLCKSFSQPQVQSGARSTKHPRTEFSY